jgi:hypothetical protein
LSCLERETRHPLSCIESPSSLDEQTPFFLNKQTPLSLNERTPVMHREPFLSTRHHRHLCFPKRSSGSPLDGERREERAEPTEEAADERMDARTEFRVSGLMYSNSRLEKRASISAERGRLGGDISGRSRVYLRGGGG